MFKKILKNQAITLIENNLQKFYNTSFEKATGEQLFRALASTTIDEMFELRRVKKKIDAPAAAKVNPKKPPKVLHYLSIEILLGKTLESTLTNLGWEKVFAEALKSKGVDIEKVYAVELDAGLGSGGLGRLAACYLDSLSTLNYPAYVHCIKYDYGIFKQRIIDGEQVEFLDNWLANGSIWFNARPDEAVTVQFGGTVVSSKTRDGNLTFSLSGAQEVSAIPYDMMISGYDAKLVGNLKLWSAKSKMQGDVFLSREAFANYKREATEVETINSILYPSSDYGRTLRIKQQYFLCSSSIQNIVNHHLRKGFDLKNLANHVSIHINDTHPTMSIPELMRILMDEHEFTWDDAWAVIVACTSYTNHTVLTEALEVWDEEIIMRVVPRIHQIICEIDRRFREFMTRKKLGGEIINQMAIISGGRVRMANLAIHASHTVNGVSKIHSDILKNSLFKNFSDMYPGKFINITNGITHRRWLIQSNPLLSNFIASKIGDKFYKNAQEMEGLRQFVDDPASVKKINEIKFANKKAFADWLYQQQGITINPNSRFDVLIKRIHEYKRQLLNVLRIIHLYNLIKENPNCDMYPQTFIFAGKAASSYYMAKRIIKLINQLAAEIDKDERANKILKVVFVENYSVTISEKLIPATDVSQQISLGGQEASGTGNMKAVLNGAIMMCTYDGANAEIAEHCGDDGAFTFGLSPDEVEQVWQDGYKPIDIYNGDPQIIGVIDALNRGFNGESFKDISSYLLCTAVNSDNYMVLADFESYIDAHEKMDELYRKPMEWGKKTLRNIANMGYFSSDRAIEEYVDKVWHLTKLKPASTRS